MAMLITINNLSIAFAFVLVASILVTHPAATELTCKTVVDSLMPCKDYLTEGGAVPSACCDSIRALNEQANTQPARQTACKCLKLAAKAYQVNQGYAAALPSTCKVNIGYAVSYSTDCDSVK